MMMVPSWLLLRGEQQFHDWPEVMVFNRNVQLIGQIDFPGSAFSVDVSSDGQYVVGGSKAVHANQFGSGGRIELIQLQASPTPTPTPSATPSPTPTATPRSTPHRGRAPRRQCGHNSWKIDPFREPVFSRRSLLGVGGLCVVTAAALFAGQTEQKLPGDHARRPGAQICHPGRVSAGYIAGVREAWVASYSGVFDDEPTAMVVDGSGNVYVTGYTAIPDYSAYVTVKSKPPGTGRMEGRL